MKTPRILVNDIGDIFFDQEGTPVWLPMGCTLSDDPIGSFDLKHHEAFELIALACNSFDALTEANARMRKALEAVQTRTNKIYAMGNEEARRAAVDCYEIACDALKVMP
jgi:hypothetical protein